jgi:hypothetical protein
MGTGECHVVVTGLFVVAISVFYSSQVLGAGPVSRGFDDTANRIQGNAVLTNSRYPAGTPSGSNPECVVE